MTSEPSSPWRKRRAWHQALGMCIHEHNLARASLSEFSRFISEHMGLSFPEECWGDLENGIAAAAREDGMQSANACARWLSTPLTRHQMETLASHLTVGETYFFREEKSFQALQEHVLPELIQQRRAGKNACGYGAPDAARGRSRIRSPSFWIG